MRVKNNTASSKVWNGQAIEAAEFYELQASEITAWSNDSIVLSDLLSGDLQLETSAIISDGVLAVNVLLDNVPKEVVTAFEKNDKRLKCIKSNRLS